MNPPHVAVTRMNGGYFAATARVPDPHGGAPSPGYYPYVVQPTSNIYIEQQAPAPAAQQQAPSSGEQQTATSSASDGGQMSSATRDFLNNQLFSEIGSGELNLN